MATLRQKPNGIWFVDYIREDGRRSRKSLGRNKPEAEHRFAAFVAQLERGAHPTRKTDSLALLSEWYRRVYLATAASATVEIADLNIGQFCAWATERGIISVSQISSAVLLDYRASVVARKVATATVAQRIELVRRMIRAAVAAGMIDSDPVREWPKTKARRSAITIYTQEQIQAALALAKAGRNTEYYHMLLFLAATGLRRADLVNLRWEFIDMAARRMKFAQSKTRTLLDAHLSPAALEALRLSGPKARGRVWPNSNGAWLSHWCCWASKRLGFHLHLHGLRHTIAVRLAQAGVALPVIMRVLGHSDLKTTLIYQHYMPGDERSPLDTLGSALVGATAPQNNDVSD